MTKDYSKQELIQVEYKNLDVLVVITYLGQIDIGSRKATENIYSNYKRAKYGYSQHKADNGRTYTATDNRK